MKKPPHVPTESGPGVRFRREIAAAVEGGASPSELVLKLTLMDSSKLKRDPQIAMDEISFGDGGMRYLGVQVKQGGVASSQLSLLADEPPPAEAAPAPVKPKRKTATKAAAKPKAKAAAEPVSEPAV